MNDLDIILWETHQRASERDNVSTGIVKVCFASNGGDLIKAITAGLQSIGGRHAPIKETYQMISDCLDGNIAVGNLLDECDGYVPGFGSSFVKGEPDPILDNIHYTLLKAEPKYSILAEDISNMLFDLGKELCPNLAFYTAAVAHYNGNNIIFCEELLIRARVDKWIKILQEEVARGT